MLAMSTPAPAAHAIIAVNVVGDQVASGLGRARTMAVAAVGDGEVTSWEVVEVGWDALHGQGAEGTHHARIVRFMREHHVDAAVTGHMGAPMLNTMQKLGVVPLVGAAGDARAACLEAAAMVAALRRQD